MKFHVRLSAQLISILYCRNGEYWWWLGHVSASRSWSCCEEGRNRQSAAESDSGERCGQGARWPNLTYSSLIKMRIWSKTIIPLSLSVCLIYDLVAFLVPFGFWVDIDFRNYFILLFICLFVRPSAHLFGLFLVGILGKAANRVAESSRRSRRQQGEYVHLSICPTYF